MLYKFKPYGLCIYTQEIILAWRCLYNIYSILLYIYITLFTVVVTVSFDQPTYMVMESGSQVITLSLDRGIATAFSVIVRPGLY